MAVMSRQKKAQNFEKVKEIDYGLDQELDPKQNGEQARYRIHTIQLLKSPWLLLDERKMKE
jgi:hypothetical protein